MPTFQTPEPISVALELGVGHVYIAASDRSDTVVEVRPSNEADESDVNAAAQTSVDYSDGTLAGHRAEVARVRLLPQDRSVDVTIELPSDSRVSGRVAGGRYPQHGTARGLPVQDRRPGTSGSNAPAPLRLTTSAGHVTAGAVAGNAEISTGTGKVQIGEIDGSGDGQERQRRRPKSTPSPATCGCERPTARSPIARAGASVDAKSSNGSIRLGEVARGSVVLATAMGDLDVGIADGTAAWLEVNTSFGQVRNQLESATRPGDADDTVEVRGRTSYGDITIRRA